MAGVTWEQAERALACIRMQFKEYIEAGDAAPELTENWKPFLYCNGRTVDTEIVPFAVVWEEGPSDWAYRAHDGGRDVELTLELRNALGSEDATVDTPAAVGWPEGVRAEPYFSYAVGLYEA